MKLYMTKNMSPFLNSGAWRAGPSCCCVLLPHSYLCASESNLSLLPPSTVQYMMTAFTVLVVQNVSKNY